jgi:transcriptional regulator with XRE-family HTH domain
MAQAVTEGLLSPLTIGDRLTLLLRHRKMTVRDLGTATGIPVGTLYKYLADKTAPPRKRVILLAEALGVTPAALEWGTGL